MSAETDELLRAYEPLPTTEKQVFVREILHRLPTVDVRERGIDEEQASDLRTRLKTFAEDWDRPETSVYDEVPTR
jgi:hypothetical protein